MSDIKQSTAYVAAVLMQNSTGDGVAGLAGSLVVKLKKAGGAFAVITPTITDRGGGWYDLALTASHTDTLGLMVFNITGPGVNPNNALQLNVVAVVGSDVVTSLSTVSTDLTSTTSTANSLDSGVTSLSTVVDDVNADIGVVGTQVASLDATITGIDTTTSSLDATVGQIASTLVTTNANISSVGSQVDTVGNSVSSVSTAMSGVNVEINNVASDVTALAAAVTAVTSTILGALMSDHAIPGSVGDGLALGAGLLQGNYYMDNVTRTEDGQTSARLRLFRTGAATAAATAGGTGQGEFATFLVTTTFASPGKVSMHKVVRQ